MSPIEGVMVVGIDTFHDPTKKGASVAGLVVSLNDTFSQWYSQTMIQKPNTELVDALKLGLSKGLAEYCQLNGSCPRNIMVSKNSPNTQFMF